MLIAPGDPDRSVLLHRLAHRGRGQMPPLVSNRVDEDAVQLFRDWIRTLKPDKPIVRQWQMDDLLPWLTNLQAERSAASGKNAFRETGCVQCHRFGGEGGSVGPDLTAVAKRVAARELLESILLPSKVVADEYATYAIETSDGRIVTGRIEREDSHVVVVRSYVAQQPSVEIEKENVLERETPAHLQYALGHGGRFGEGTSARSAGLSAKRAGRDRWQESLTVAGLAFGDHTDARPRGQRTLNSASMPRKVSVRPHRPSGSIRSKFALVHQRPHRTIP